MIRLVGPGSAGKSSCGPLLAERLGVPFVDLDERFDATVGDISKYIESHGYHAYAARNVRVYADLIGGVAGQEGVLALSSGFMTYREDIHPDYVHLRRDIAASPMTFVLLPSLDFETCVAEIVWRQIGRPFSRPAEREEQVIRARFELYREIPATKIETMRPVAEVVEAIVASLAEGGHPRLQWTGALDARAASDIDIGSPGTRSAPSASIPRDVERVRG